jgi:hypothetical protein
MEQAAEKRRLLDFVVSNSVWKEGKIVPAWRQPFDMIALANESAHMQTGGEMTENGLNQNWLPTGSTTVINVTGNVTGMGGSLVINGTQFAGTQANGAGILFNFSGATSVNINQQLSASILAPSATFSSSSQIDGNVIVSTVTASGETHDALFTGGNNLPNPVTTPEPVSFVTLGGGLLALAFFTRKYQRY